MPFCKICLPNSGAIVYALLEHLVASAHSVSQLLQAAEASEAPRSSSLSNRTTSRVARDKSSLSKVCTAGHGLVSLPQAPAKSEPSCQIYLGRLSRCSRCSGPCMKGYRLIAVLIKNEQLRSRTDIIQHCLVHLQNA